MAKAILICAGFAATYMLIAGSSTLWDRDEPRYARVTVEMTESGNYLVPTFNGEVWFDKPILLYWLMSIPVRLFGPSEIACRSAAVIGTAVTLLMTFFIGKKLFDTKAGLWGEAILATSLLMMVVGSLAIVDGVAMPFIVGTMAIFISRIGKKIRIIDAVISGALMGLGMLAKGPIGLLPAPVMIMVFWFGRRSGIELIGDLAKVGLSIIVATGIFLMWSVPANKATGGEFVRVFLGHHILARAIMPMESHGGRFLLYLPYYPAVMIAGFFPWVGFLPGAFSAVIGKRIGADGSRNILISWVVATVVLMTLVATKLPHYVLFAWPAMAVMVGGTIAAVGENVLNEQDRKWLRSGVWFLGPVGLGLASGLIIAGYFLKMEGLKLPGLICGLVILAMTVICGGLQVLGRFGGSAKIILAGVAALVVPVLFGLLPAIEQIKISPPISRAIKEKTGNDVPVAMYEYDEPTLNFYIGRHIELLRGEDAIVTWAQQPKYGALIIPKEVLAGVEQRYGIFPLEQIAAKKGFNYSKGKALEVLALIRKTEN